MNILAVVGSQYGENPYRRKGKGSLAMSISQGLVGPNQSPNGVMGKGKWLIFHYYANMRGDTSFVSDALE